MKCVTNSDLASTLNVFNIEYNANTDRQNTDNRKQAIMHVISNYLVPSPLKTLCTMIRYNEGFYFIYIMTKFNNATINVMEFDPYVGAIHSWVGTPADITFKKTIQ